MIIQGCSLRAVASWEPAQSQVGLKKHKKTKKEPLCKSQHAGEKNVQEEYLYEGIRDVILWKDVCTELVNTFLLSMDAHSLVVSRDQN